MNGNKVNLAGSELLPAGKRVGDQPKDETITVSVILKPKQRAVAPPEGGAVVSRAEFAASYGADSAAIDKTKQFAAENNLAVSEVSAERRTKNRKETAANMCHAFDVRLDRYEHDGQVSRARTGIIKNPAELAGSVEAVLGLDD